MRIIVSAGGTGGHIFPALAIINKIIEKEPDSKILYIGTTNRMESKIIPERGIMYQGIEMMGLDRKNIINNIKFLSCLRKAKKKAYNIIKDFNPDIVIGVGGYITFPVISAAKKLGIKTFIHEQNSILGLSNKLLIKKVDKVGVSLESSLKYFKDKSKVEFTGNPRSEEVYNAKKANKKDYGLDNSKRLVLIVMGSLGSNTISNSMIDILPKFKGKDYEVLFVTGKNYYDKFKDMKLPDNVKIIEFINDMPGLLKCTDLIVTRAGASTIAEITALGIPSILIPSPYVTHNHQFKNAKVLEEKNASILIEEKDFNSDILLDSIDNVLNDPKKYDIMKTASLDLGINDSTTRIYNILKDLINGD